MTVTFDPSPDFYVADGRSTVVLVKVDSGTGNTTNHNSVDAIGQRLTGSHEDAGGVELFLVRRAWLLDGTTLNTGVEPVRGDRVTAPDNTTWVIESSWYEPLAKQWHCETVKRI